MIAQLAPALAPVAHASRRSRPTGLVPGTLVRTEEGEMPVEFLMPGDRILTATGSAVLRGLSLLEARDVELVEIAPKAPFGAGRKRALRVPAHQQLLVSDWRASVLYGRAQMLTRAEALVDDHAVIRITRKSQRLIRLHFDRPEVIWADGIAVSSARTRAPSPAARRILH